MSQRSNFFQEGFYDQLLSEELSDSDLPIWLAAQRAVPRYEGLLSSVGPRGRLLRRLLTWTGIIPSVPETSLQIDTANTTSEEAEHYERFVYVNSHFHANYILFLFLFYFSLSFPYENLGKFVRSLYWICHYLSMSN